MKTKTKPTPRKCDRCKIGVGTHTYDMSKYLLCDECHDEWDRKWYPEISRRIRLKKQVASFYQGSFFSFEDKIWHEVFAEFMAKKPPKVKVMLV